MKKTGRLRRVISFVVALTLIVGLIPMSAFEVSAASWDIKNGGEVYTGQTAELTCYGGAAYQITNVIFEATTFPTIAKVTGYDSDGTITYEKDVFGSYRYSKTFCYGGDKFIIEVLYGSIEISYNTANTIGPSIVCQENGLGMDYLIKPNMSTMYLEPGESQELYIQDVYPGYQAELRDDCFSSNNINIATVTKDGVVTANREGETQVDILYTITNAAGNSIQLTEPCDVIVVDDAVNKETGLRFYYADEEIEPGDTVQIGADYSFGDFTGMYYPGTVEWRVSNEDVLKIIQTVDNITIVRVEALAMGECELSLVLDGEVKCKETINVTITDDTLISMYKDYLMDCAVMTTLADARNTSWDVIDRYSSGNKARIAFMTCLKSDLGLSVITKEVAAAVGLTSSTHDDTVDEAIDLLMAEIFSSEEAAFSDGLSTFKKRFKAYGAFTKSTSFTGGSVASALSQVTSFSESQINSVEGLANGFIGDGITMAELVSSAVMTVQYERDVVISLMNTVAAAPGGTSSDLYKGLERLLFEMDNLELYVATRYLNNEMVDGLKDLIKDGLFSKDAKIFNKTIWNVASGMGYLISRAYAHEGGIFADDYMKACITAGFAGTLCNVVKNSDSALELEYSFKFYVSSVKVALNAAIDICEDATVNCLDLKYIAEGYLNQINATCTYENLLEQCRRAVIGASDFKSNVYMEDGEIVVDAYWELPETKKFKLTKDVSNFYTTGYTADQLIIVPSHINGEKVTGIAANGFDGITNKHGIVLPDSVVRIGEYAFANCPHVKFVVLGDNLKEIGTYAFSNNVDLQVVNLPASLEIIKEGAFSNCGNISSIITEASQIETKAFENCTALTSVTIKNKSATIAADAFDNCNSELTIYGHKNTDAEEIANAKGYTFVELSETVASFEIATPATKTEYEVGDVIDTSGMTLNVTYMDGTIEIVNDGWVAYADTSVAGNASAKVYYGEKTATYNIVVNKTEFESVELKYSNLIMIYGGDMQLTAQILPNASNNVKIIWSASEPSVVAVDSNGFLEAMGTGTATITATVLNSDVKATCQVTVVDSKEINPANSTTDYITFTARENGYYVFYSVGSDRSITGSILDINGNTLYTNSATNFRVEGQLHKDKTYILKTSTNSKNNVFNVVINKSVDADNLTIKDSSGTEISEISAYPNDVKYLYYGFSPVNYITEKCTWESSNTSVAKIDKNGKITMVAPGTATITLTSENGLTDTCNVVVNRFVDAPTINVNETKQVAILEEYDRVYYSFTPEEAGWYALCSIGDGDTTSCYLLDSDGMSLASGIYGGEGNNFRLEYDFAAGETYVFMCDYYYSSSLGTYDVKLEKMIPAETVSIVEGDSFTKYIKETVNLSVDFAPKYCIKETITWASDNTAVATVNSQGKVTMVGPGEAKISATSENGLIDECTITVLDYPTIGIGEQKNVEINDNFKNRYFYFTPEKDGTYIFYSVSNSDTYGYLLDSNGSTLKTDDQSGEGSNFRIEYALTGGETYVLRCKYYYSSTTGSFDVFVYELVDAEYVQITEEESYTGYVESQHNLVAELLPMISRDQSLTWSSSNDTIVAVDQSGKINLLQPGEATITVTTESGLTDSIVVTVEDFPTIQVNESKNIEISTKNNFINVKFTPTEDGWYTFYSTGDGDTICRLYDNSGTELSYDDNSGTDSNFRVECNLSAGETYIFKCSYVSSGVTGSYTVNLEQANANIDETLVLDKEYQLYSETSKTTTFTAETSGFYKITAVQRDKNDYPDIWDNVSITVTPDCWHAGTSRGYSENGYYVYEDSDIYYFEDGEEYNVSIYSNGLLATKLTVSKVPDPTGISISRDSMSLTEGEYGQSLSVTLSPQYTYGHYVWTSSNESVATVDEYGNVKPVGTGEAIITVSVKGTSLTASCAVSVEGVEKTELIIGEEYSDLPIGVYFVQPSVSGYYTVLFNDCYMDLNDGKYNRIGWLNSSYNMACKYLEAGKTYIFEITSIYNDGAYGSIQECVAPSGISLDKEIKLTPDSLKTLYVTTQNEGSYFDHASATFTIADPEIAEITTTYSRGNMTPWSQFYESYFTIQGLKIGQTTITITTKDGGVYTFPVVIEDYPYIYEGAEFELPLASDENAIYRFIPDESASFTLEASGTQGCSIYVRDENNKYLTGVGENYWGAGHYVSVSHEFEKGKTYFLEIEGDFLYDGNFVFKLNKTVEANELALSATSISGFVDESFTLSYELLPTYSFPETVSWQSSDDTIATVDENGNVVLVGVGTATIIATATNGITATCAVEVKIIPAISCDEEKQLTTEVESGTGLYKFVPEEDGIYCFYSYNNNFDTYGYILDAEMNEITRDDDSGEGNNFSIQYGLNAGQTYYLKARPYSTSSTGTYCIKVIHLVPASSISINIGDTYSAFVGTHLSLSVEFAPQNSIVEGVTWTSSEPSVATVDEDGNVSLLMAGTTTITATSDNGLTTTCTITVEDYPTITENEDVTVDLNQNDPYAYFYFTPEEDGYYVFYSESNNDTYGYIFDAELNQLNSDDDSGDGSNFRVGYQMESGTTYILEARFYNTSTNGSFSVKIEKSKYISNLEITSLPIKTEYVKGFASNNLDYDGLKLKATWSDGTTTDWKMNVDDYYIGDQRVSIYSSNVDEDGIIRITCGGKEVTYTLTLIDNPVDHLEVVKGTSYSYVEHYNGYFDENNDGEYFYYYTDYPSDAEIKIVYVDGTSITAKPGQYVDGYSVSWAHDQYNNPWTVGTDNQSTISYLGHDVNLPIVVDENKVASIEVVSGKVTCVENINGYEMGDGYYYYYDMPSNILVKITYTDDTSETVNVHDNIDGHSFDWNADQYENPWTLGDDNYVTLSYLGVTTQLPVSVIANPVEHIEVTVAPTREYVYGDTEYGYLYSDGDYEFYPNDITGLSFTVYYTDGTSKTFTDEDIDEYGKINGYGYELSYDEYNPEIGDFPVTFTYMGKIDNYTVLLKESTVESISITKLPNKVEYSDYYSPDFVGMEITITYVDGTSNVVTLSDENLVYDYNPWRGGLVYEIEIDGYTLIIEPYYGDDIYYVMYYLGSRCEINDITFTEREEIKSIELDDISWNGDGMNIKITYADETAETLTLNIAAFYTFEDSSVAGFGKTENGLLYYYIETYTDGNGNVEKYLVNILGKDITVEVETDKEPCRHEDRETDDGTLATCTSSGYTAGVYCNDCQKYISGHTEIAINTSNHVNTKNVAEVPATTENVGYTAGVYCNDCKKYISGHKEIAKIEVSFTDSANAKEFGNNILANSDLSAEKLLSQASKGATLKTADGKDVDKNALIGTGMILTLADGSKKELVVYGDVDGDGKISASDARLALRASVGLENYKEDSCYYKAANVESQDKMSASDARFILRASVGLENPKQWLK